MLSPIIWKDKEVKTKNGNLLQTPYAKLQKALQAEWDNCQKPTPETMPLTARTAAVIDILPSKRDQIQADATQYIDADVLCYFADNDASLITYQHTCWDEQLNWIEGKLKISVQTTSGISHVKQSDAYHTAAGEILHAPNDWHFYALQNFITMSHSFILGYRLYLGDLRPEQATSLSCADALYQEKQWGSDEEAVATRQALTNEIQEVQNYLHLLKE